ncbi:MAG: hypothetical protein EBQ56_11575 [Proteobacteria bacterium]|jgi:hypothetical protein|nr:hypothetical protein [Pseudomonadota bacterium]NCV22131.1 hypothetical protein [Chloroflexota bacterium]NBQ32502.1 hypothetical protein [Pseudomonadota bacterium]NBQ62508.1 hypothetical protein [Pseudomonadota bacterium]NBT04584.1 hypothetical protein [Pseudomonadota bacterium]
MMETTHYELPEEGISLLGYVVRRMHKTRWLMPVSTMVASGQSQEALAHVAVYAMLSSTSYGRAGYQPSFNRAGDVESEADPVTGASVTARVVALRPRIAIDYDAVLTGGETFSGSEEILGTTFGLRGLGMAAPSRFTFTAPGYSASLDGTITSELTLAIFGGTRVRGYGSLAMSDSTGNRGEITIDRDQKIVLTVAGERYGVNLATWTVARPAEPVPRSF